jgi:hypothetical protein
MSEPLLFFIPQVAIALGATQTAVRRMIERGIIPSRRLGRRIVVIPDELRKHIASLQTGRRPAIEEYGSTSDEPGMAN